MLTKGGVLCKTDTAAVACYCQAWAEWVCALAESEKTAEEGGGYKFTSVTANGTIVQHPLVGIVNKKWAMVLKAAAVLGITPADRSSVAKVPGEEPEDAFDALVRTAMTYSGQRRA